MKHPRPLAAAALFAVAWGGNEFTPLLVMYRTQHHLPQVTVNVLLFAYVLGIIPALLIGGPLSDRYGRRPILIGGLGLYLAGLLLALTHIGGELAQLMLSLPAVTVQVFQGMLLFFLLAFDTLGRFRIRWGRPGEARA